MTAALWLAAVIAVPGIVFIAQVQGMRWLSEGEVPRVLRPLARRLEPLARRIRPRPEEEPLPPELLTLELRRLSVEIRTVEGSDQPHRAARLRAALAAYDRVLLELCERSDVPAPTGLPPLSSHVRLDLEAELVATGVDW